MINYRLVVIGFPRSYFSPQYPALQLLRSPLVRVNPISTIPSPKSVLGFAPGDDRTIADWTQITNYFSQLDKSSDRVVVQSLGQSTLKRPLIVAILARERIYWLLINTKHSTAAR